MKAKKIILFFLKWSAVIAYLSIALSFVGKRSEQVVCSSIEVTIKDSLQNAFVTHSDVLEMIEHHHSNLIGIPLKMINTLKIEQALNNLDAVMNATVYKTVDGKLNVLVEQRKPMVRVINRKGQSYYIDNEGYILPLSKKFTSHVMVINGNIDEPYKIEAQSKIPLSNGLGNKKSTFMTQLFLFAKYLYEDNFWASQITQIYVGNAQNIELIPLVGSHTILLGSLDGYIEKLDNLKLFYSKGLPNEGWNKYQQINLKYRNQIVCTKK